VKSFSIKPVQYLQTRGGGSKRTKLNMGVGMGSTNQFFLFEVFDEWPVNNNFVVESIDYFVCLKSFCAKQFRIF